MSLPAILPVRPKPDTGKAGPRDLWAEALKTLTTEEQRQFSPPDTKLLDVLFAIQDGTEKNKDQCLAKGWTIYRNKQGEAVKLRHVLEKMSTWVKAAIKVVDFGVGLDHSGHAALPWGIIKYLVTVFTDDIAFFSQVSETVEFISSLLARYVVFEKLYLHEDCEATPKLNDAICELYAAILRYLSKARTYFGGNSLKRMGHSLRESVTKNNEQLKSKITEVNVEKWADLVDAELDRKLAKDAKDNYEALKSILNGLNQPIMQISDQVSQLNDKLNEEERRTIFQWISKIEYRKHHDDLSAGLLTGTGQWLIKSAAYIEWGQSSVSSILWLHGSPGTGKTRLVSTVINNIFDAYSHLTVPPIAYFYCLRSDAEKERGMPIEILRAILRQLSSTAADRPIKKSIAEEYEIRKRKAERDGSNIKDLSLEDCVRLILDLTDQCPVTIIIDALDECDPEQRYQLFDALDTIMEKSKEIVKIFVSSRDDVDIQLHLEHCSNVSIGAEQNSPDIDRFIQSEVDRLIRKRVLLSGMVNSKLRSKIVRYLSKGAQGMFRWVAMSLEVLCKIKDKVDFSNQLGKLPPLLADLYSIVYKQIDQTGLHGRAVALTSLKWLLCAERLLSVEEFVAIVSNSVNEVVSSPVTGIVLSDSDVESVDTDSSSEYDGEINTITPTDILRQCRNLVVKDTKVNAFRFAHLSVQEYLQKRSELSFEELHFMALERCLNVYLSRPSSITTDMKDVEILRKYAQYYWPVHFQKADHYILIDPERRKRILPFFIANSEISQAYVTWCLEAAHSDAVWTMDDPDVFISSYGAPHSPLKAAYAFGLHTLVDEFDKIPQSLWTPDLVGHQDVRSQTLLHLAALGGHMSALKVLQHRMFELDPKDEEGQTPLMYAAQKGHEAVVRLLLETGQVDPDSKDNGGRTPLMYAAEAGHESAARLLLETGKVDPDSKNDFSWTPLMYAAEAGHESVVRLLLETGKVDPDSKNDFSWTPLMYAINNGHETVVRLLLETGKVDPDLKDNRSWTPLMYAADNGHESVVRLLLETGKVDPDWKNNETCTPLMYAAGYGHESVARLLLETGQVGPDPKADEGWTPLMYTADNGHEAVVRLLLETGKVDPDSKNDRSRTPLMYAAEAGHESAARLLLETGQVDPDSKDNESWTPLMYAARNGHYEIVRLLLETNKVNPDTKNNDRDRALMLAREFGYNAVVELLEAWGAKEEHSFELERQEKFYHLLL